MEPMVLQPDPVADWLVGWGIKIFWGFVIYCVLRNSFRRTLTQKELEEELTGEDKEEP